VPTLGIRLCCKTFLIPNDVAYICNIVSCPLISCPRETYPSVIIVLPNINEKFRRELERLNALLIINIVVGATGMGLSISYGVQRALAITLPITVDSLALLPLIALGLAGFAVSIWWLISTVETFSDVQEIKDEYGAAAKAKDGDSTTSLIVKSMSYYRAKLPSIRRMAWVSRIAGICFVALAIYGLAASLLGFGEANLMLAAASFILNLAIGAVALYVPHSFFNLSTSWDFRLKEGAGAEASLKKGLEGQA